MDTLEFLGIKGIRWKEIIVLIIILAVIFAVMWIKNIFEKRNKKKGGEIDKEQ